MESGKGVWGVDGIYLAKIRDLWWALRSPIMNLLVSIKCCEFTD
jgi:hypothetical protein